MLSGDFLTFDESAGELRSWESFYDKNVELFPNPYISEIGPAVFDALLSSHAAHNAGVSRHPSIRVLRPGSVLACLAQLGLRRDSVLYSYDFSHRTFRAQPGAEHVRLPEFSL